MSQTLLEAYGEYVAASQDAPLSADTLHHARRALLDWLGALIAGRDVDAARYLRQAYSTELHGGPCTVIGTTHGATPRAAAFLNGTISHLAEIDDIFRDAVYHPGSPIISAVFALAEVRATSLHTLLRAIIAGYEVSTRIGSAVQPSHYRFFHTTGTVGVFGAAAACASLLRLNATQAMHAMATAGTFASGLQQAFRSDAMTKPMHAGHAAEVGVNAAMCAEAGMTGTPDLLEGSAGFGSAMSAGADWSAALDGLGTAFNIERMTFKNHACCGHTFAAIDGAAALQSEHAIAPEDIASIHLGVYQAAKAVCAYRHPQSAFEAKFSLSYTVAARLMLGRVREAAFAPDALKDARIHALEDKISVHLDPARSAVFPGVRSAEVSIELRSGERFTRVQSTRHGDPDDPLSDAELFDKFQEFVEPRIGTEAMRALADAALSTTDGPSKVLSQHWTRP